jgi:hypothetical protein
MPLGVCKRYGDMPICREFRYFIEAGRFCCSHPYWPKDALDDGGAMNDGGFEFTNADYHLLCAGRHQALDRLAEAAGKAVGGALSLRKMSHQIARLASHAGC